MREIPLSQGKTALVSDDDYPTIAEAAAAYALAAPKFHGEFARTENL